MSRVKLLVFIPELSQEHKLLILERLESSFLIYFDVENAPVDKIEVLLIFKWGGVINDSLLQRMKSLKLVQSITAGIDHIPVKELAKLGVEVQGAPGANSHYIAEHSYAMMLSAVKKICWHTRRMREGEFHQEAMHRTLIGKNLLILGFGTIGQEVCRIARAFHMKVRVFKKSPQISDEFKGVVEKVYLNMEELVEAWPWADFIVLALPLSEELKGFIGEKELKLMKKDACLVNVARGKLIDEKALYEHLVKNEDFIACLDTWWVYPEEGERFEQHYPFHQLENVLMTPHIAPKVPGFFENMLRKACEILLKRFS